MSRIFNLKITVPKGTNTGYQFGTTLGSSAGVLITDSFAFFDTSILDGTLMPYVESLTHTIEDGGVEFIITMQLTMADNTPSTFIAPFIFYIPDTAILYIAQFVEYISTTAGGVSQLYKDIKAQISSLLNADNEPVFKTVHIWNNQLANERADVNKQFAYPKPAVFVEISTPTPIGTLLGGFQQYDDIRVRLHIIHEQYDANGNGFMDEDFNIFDFSQLLYGKMNKFEPPGAVRMVRVAEEQDYDHDNLYHFIQEYQTNLIDGTQTEPKGGMSAPGPFSLQLNLNFNPSPFIKNT